MATDRKGFMTTDQQNKLDSLIKIKNPLLETLDGPFIQLADDVGLEVLAKHLENSNPMIYALVIQIIDTVFAAIPEK